MFWSYLRSRARKAFLAGLSDALAELDGPHGDDDTDGALALLRARLQPALSAPAAAEEEGQPATDGTPLLTAGRNGRRKS